MMIDLKMFPAMFGENLYPGHILTDLSDVAFLSHVMRAWGQYSQKKIEAEIAGVDPQEFAKNGFFVGELGSESIILLKVGKGTWVAPGYESQELEEFVESLDQIEVESEAGKLAYLFGMFTFAFLAILSAAIADLYIFLAVLASVGTSKISCLTNLESTCMHQGMWILGVAVAMVISWFFASFSYAFYKKVTR